MQNWQATAVSNEIGYGCFSEDRRDGHNDLVPKTGTVRYLIFRTLTGPKGFNPLQYSMHAVLSIRTPQVICQSLFWAFV